MLKRSTLIVVAGCATALLAAGSSAAHVGRTAVQTNLLVKFRPSASPSQEARLLADSHASVSGVIAHIGVSRVSVSQGEARQALARLRHAHSVVFAERDTPLRLNDTAPTDPLYSAAQPLLAPTKVPAVWDAITGGPITVAVVDSGVSNVADLSDALLPGTDLVNGDADPTDDNGHGTDVAEIIAGRANNAVGSAGICWSCKILPVKVMDSTGAGLASTTATGIVWAADNGARIINLSLGGPTESQTDADAVTYAQSKGVLVVAAAGNNDPGTSQLEYPAAYPGVVSVAASDAQDNKRSYSQYGDWVSVAAPDCLPEPPYLIMTAPGFCGTSGAAPVVSGIAALALTAAPSLSQDALAEALQQTADPVPGDYVHSGRVNAQALIASLGSVGAPAKTVTPSAPEAAPTNTELPQISGDPKVGGVLSTGSGNWQDATTYSYSWHRCDSTGTTCAPITGATFASYVVKSEDSGMLLFVRILASGPGGDTMVSSSTVGPVQSGPARPKLVKGPSLKGHALVGATLRASAGTWQNVTNLSYQWYRCDKTGQACTTVSGATGLAYHVSKRDKGQRVKVRVRALGAGGVAYASSRATPRVNG